MSTNDSDDLEALFDTIAAKTSTMCTHDAIASVAQQDSPNNMLKNIGQMARSLHDSLRELGLNKEIESAASSIPDARDRLNYVATLTQQAADKVLNATDAAQPIVNDLSAEATRLSAQWSRLFEKELDAEVLKLLVAENIAYLKSVPTQSKIVSGHLMNIMMAQDFQDLTGQVIKKTIAITQDIEQKLVHLLLENAPSDVKADHEGLLNGPVINPNGRLDVATSQDQVDDLLESMGF